MFYHQQMSLSFMNCDNVIYESKANEIKWFVFVVDMVDG